MVIFLLTLLLTCVFIIFYIKNTTNYWKRRNINGPKPIPIFGNIIESVLRRKNLATIYQEIYNDFSEEKVVGIYTMTSPALLIRDIEIIKQILVKDFNSFSERGFMISKDKLGESLFHCDSNTWRALRGKLTPYFTIAKLKNSFNIVTECGDVFVQYVENLIHTESVQEMHQLFRKFGIDATLIGIFDLKIDTYNDDSKAFLQKLDKSIFTKSYLSEISMVLLDFMIMTNTSIFGAIAVKFCNNIVKNANYQIKYNTMKKCVMNMLLDLKNEEITAGKLDKRIKNKFKVSDDVIASQVFILFAAGYENTCLSLSYAFYHLAKNIDLQDRLAEEIDSSLIKNNGKLTYEVLNEMTYLEKVFNETLRIQPFANTLQRVAMEDYTIPGIGIEIKKGMTVLISPLAIHQDDKFYKDPKEFDPERFNPENLKNRDSCSFLPFGLGPRSCFGYTFTKLLFKVAMVKILSKFIVRISDKTREMYIDPCRTMLAMKGGIHLSVQSRKNILNL